MDTKEKLLLMKVPTLFCSLFEIFSSPKTKTEMQKASRKAVPLDDAIASL